METMLHYYYFDISNEAEAQAYGNVCYILKHMGLKVFSSISTSTHSKWYKEQIKPLDNKIITLETNYLFNNQWNTGPTKTSTSGLRVFDWAEAIYSNRHIKEGYWLEQTKEMKEIRRNTVKCGYCGKMYQAQQGYVFCNKCLDSEYLKEDELHLLRLLPVDAGIGARRQPLTDAERDWLLPQYIEQQTKGNAARNTIRQITQREKIKSNYEKAVHWAQTEHDGLLWLLDHNVSIDNCIYYNHTGRFGFGWRSPVSQSVESALLDALCEFPYDYDITAG